ncbi:MAG: hypothetical protein AWU57_311 [Marinobacter sp. T13-3]|nr:MAG: hypothetical protein AWU57_311 [Marinobacter sp. T13-3]
MYCFDYIRRCAITLAFVLTPMTGHADALQPVFAVEVPASEASVESEVGRTDSSRKTFCREVLERAKPINRQLPVHLMGRDYLGLRQIMVTYTRLRECHITAQVLIKRAEAVDALARAMLGNAATDPERRASLSDWVASGKGVGSIVAEVNRALLSRPPFQRFAGVPFVRLHVNAVLIGDRKVKEFTFPMRVSQGQVPDNPVGRVTYEIVETAY